MAQKKDSQSEHGTYATVAEDEGVNYREIADVMTELGFKMNHSSARNYVLRVMRKFADAFNRQYELNMSESKIDSVSRSPDFQQGVAEILQRIESSRRDRARAAP